MTTKNKKGICPNYYLYVGTVSGNGLPTIFDVDGNQVPYVKLKELLGPAFCHLELNMNSSNYSETILSHVIDRENEIVVVAKTRIMGKDSWGRRLPVTEIRVCSTKELTWECLVETHPSLMAISHTIPEFEHSEWILNKGIVANLIAECQKGKGFFGTIKDLVRRVK